MDITKHLGNDGVTHLAVAGELDMATAAALRDAITTALAGGGVAGLCVDLDAVTFCDASGVNALLAGRADAIAVGASYRVINPRGLVLRLLRLAGTLPVLTGVSA